MVHAFARPVFSAPPQYTVYIYHHPENRLEGQNDWEIRTITADLKQALREAASLYESQGYRMVEIKKRVTNPKTAQSRDRTLKIFDGRSGKTLTKAVYFSALVFTVSTALGIFLRLF